MTYEIDKIDSIDIYSFNNFDFLKEFVSKHNLAEYDYKTDDSSETASSSSSSTSRKYNTRSRLTNVSNEARLNDSLSLYLNKLDTDSPTLDTTRDELFSTQNLTTSKRQTRSQTGKISLPECGKTYCRLGCICDKADSKKKAQSKHCGRFECMFECNCARQLRSSTRTKSESQKTCSPGSVCSRSSSNSSTCLRKSKRSKNKVNYFYYSKQGSSCSESSNVDVKRADKFKPYNDTVDLGENYKINLEILSKNYEVLKFKVLDFINNFLVEFRNFTWKELHFSYDKTLSVRLAYADTLHAKITKYKPKENAKVAVSRIVEFLKSFPQFSVQLFKCKKSVVNKENKVPDEDKPTYKILPRLLCRKSTLTQAPELKKIFNNLDTLFKQIPKVKFEKISDTLRTYRSLDKISLFKDEADYFRDKSKYDLYDPFTDDTLVLSSYRLVDSRDIVDSVSCTLNDMISVVCTHKENMEKKIDLNDFLPSFNEPMFVRPNVLKRKSNVIILNKKELGGSMRNILHLPQSGRTFVKILNTSEKNVMPISIVSKPMVDKPIFKVAFDNAQRVSSLATIKNDLIRSVQENSKKRKRKQDLSFLSTKTIDVNANTCQISKDDHCYALELIEQQLRQQQHKAQLLVSNALFLKSKKLANTRNDSESTDDVNSVSIKEEPDTNLSDSTNYSQRYLTIEHFDESDLDAQNSLASEASTYFEQKYSPTNISISMLKFDNNSNNNTNSSYSNSDNSNQKISLKSSSSSIPNVSDDDRDNYDEDDDDANVSNDSDLENEDDFFNKSSASSSTTTDGRKNISSNIHSIRERQRRLRLKNLLNKLKYALYDIDENTPNLRSNPKLKHSKQATLAEAVDLVKSMEARQHQMTKEYRDLYQQHLLLRKKREFLLSQI